MKRNWLVLNPTASTYEVVSGPRNITEVAEANECATVEVEGEVIKYRTPDFQVIEIGHGLKMFNMYKGEGK